MFHTSSLENAPQNWDSDPIYAKVYQQCLMEVLSSDDSGGSFPIVKVMEKVKAAQPNGYDYAVYTSALGQPVGLMQMVPAQKVACLRFGDIIAIDSQDKTKTTYGWVGTFPSGWNGNKKLQNFCDAISLEATDRWFAWVLENMCRMSGRPLGSIKIIPCDMGPCPDNTKDYLPREHLFF